VEIINLTNRNDRLLLSARTRFETAIKAFDDDGAQCYRFPYLGTLSSQYETLNHVDKIGSQLKNKSALDNFFAYIDLFLGLTTRLNGDINGMKNGQEIKQIITNFFKLFNDLLKKAFPEKEKRDLCRLDVKNKGYKHEVEILHALKLTTPRVIGSDALRGLS
jgi:hypothetical protein